MKPVDIVEKVSSNVEKDPSLVEHVDIVEKAQDIKIGAGLDDKIFDEDGKQSGVKSGAEDG